MKSRIKKVMKKILPLMITFCLFWIFVTNSITNNEVGAADYSTAGCVSWVKDRASQIGITLPQTGYNKYGLAGASAYWDKLPAYGYTVGSEPMANALAVWEFSSNSDYRNYGHVAYVESVDGNNVTLTEGGLPSKYSYGGHTGVRQVTVSKGSVSSLGGCSGFYGYVYLTTPSSYNPQGCVDSISGGKGSVSVWGWTFDRDAIATPIDVHVYVDDECLGGWTAGVSRTDVDSVYHCGAFHGFDMAIKTNKIGWHHVRLYAINVGGGNNVCIGEADVYIEPADAEKPVISDVKIVEADSQGYVVECKASDNEGISKVQCPTWTDLNGQDDIASDWINNSGVTASKVGDVYRYRVNISDHNNEYGKYITHIYAFDEIGNNVSVAVHATVANEKMPSVIEKYNNSLLAVFEETLSWNEMNTFADSMGSSLVSVENAEKNNFLYNLIKSHYKTHYFIGAYRTSKTDSWKWKDGNTFSYSHWYEGEPNCTDDVEFYAAMIKNKQGFWNDMPEYSNNTGFIVEVSLDLEETVSIETDDKIYRFYNESLPYSIAKRFCKENGGSLVCIETEEENNLLAKKVKQLKRSYYIGASDTAEEGVFKWENGEKVIYSNWLEGEPNNSIYWGDEDYVQMRQDGTWNDAVGQRADIGFIAEFDKTPVSSKPSDDPTPTDSSTPSETLNKVKGDVNGDKKVDLNDAKIILKLAVGIEVKDIITRQGMLNADYDNNEKIDLNDAKYTLKSAVGIKVVIP